MKISGRIIKCLHCGVEFKMEKNQHLRKFCSKKCGYDARKGTKRIFTKEWCANMSLARKGTKQSKETVEKRRRKQIGKVRTPEQRKKISDARKGIIFTPEHRENIRKSRIGKTTSLETKLKLREANLIRIAEGRHNNYKGGITTEHERIRKSIEYKAWRKAVYERDGYKCVLCGTEGDGKNLNADHIKGFSQYPELRLDINNGRTLCKKCHVETENYGWKAYNLTHNQSNLLQSCTK